MAISKKDERTIRKIMMESFHEIQSDRLFRDTAKEKYKQTERRLRAYPLLKKNIERYEMDIEDIKHEDLRRSTDIVLYRTAGGGMKADIEEIREIKILNLKQKIIRDETEIKEVDAALETVKNDEYFSIIDLKYFQNLKHEEIAEMLECDTSTIGRNKGRMVNHMALVLYGSDAL